MAGQGSCVGDVFATALLCKDSLFTNGRDGKVVFEISEAEVLHFTSLCKDAAFVTALISDVSKVRSNIHASELVCCFKTQSPEHYQIIDLSQGQAAPPQEGDLITLAQVNGLKWEIAQAEEASA